MDVQFHVDVIDNCLKTLFIGSPNIYIVINIRFWQKLFGSSFPYNSRNSAACISQVVIFQYPCKDKFRRVGIAVRNVVAKIFLQ